MGTLQSLARSLGADERTLRRAVTDGTVRATRPSRRALVIDDHERAYLRDHWRSLSKLRAALRTEPNVRLAVLFGSTARGDDRPDSDIDVLVSLAHDRPAAVSALSARLEQRLGVPVDVARLNRVEVAEPLLLLSAVEEGRVLIDRDDLWPRVQERRAAIARRARRAHAARRRRAGAAIAELLGEGDA